MKGEFFKFQLQQEKSTNNDLFGKRDRYKKYIPLITTKRLVKFFIKNFSIKSDIL